MAHAQKPDFVFRRNGRVQLNLRGRQFSRLLAAEVCASAVVMLDTPSSEVVWRVLATHCIRQFPLHFPSRASPCTIIFQLESTCFCVYKDAVCTPRITWCGPLNGCGPNAVLCVTNGGIRSDHYALGVTWRRFPDRIIYCQMEGRLGCVPSSTYRQLNWQWPVKKIHLLFLSRGLCYQMEICIASVLTSEAVLWVIKLQRVVLRPSLVKAIRPTVNVCLRFTVVRLNKDQTHLLVVERQICMQLIVVQ